MIHFTSGDLLASDAYALVNTVNCEGYMGKGIAYQFKLRFPQMNEEYIKKCRRHEITPGELFCYKEQNRLIINFPTKTVWREKSQIQYIETGLDALVKLLQTDKSISSIAIPPLGCGNGGLNWPEVKEIILQRLSVVSPEIDIFVYEPSHSYQSVSIVEPQLSLSALLLMQIKMNIKPTLFGKISLQKTAYFMTILSGDSYFHFIKEKYGPYDHSIEIVSKLIKQFQAYHGVNNTKDAYDILYKKLISKKIESQLSYYMPLIVRASDFTNHFRTTDEIEGAGTALYIIQTNQVIDIEGIISKFKSWSDDKARRFSIQSIQNAVDELEKYGFIVNAIGGYRLI